MYDCDAYVQYSNHHKWFNKLWLAEQLGYVCGPVGVPVPKAAYYIVRPIYNVSGMGIGAERRWLVPENDVIIPGHFWCEEFKGIQYTFDLKFNWAGPPFWKVIRGYRCEKYNLQQFFRFIKEPLYDDITLPHFFHDLSEIGIINIEMIGDKIIEVHLRSNPDPEYDELIPVWKDKSIDKEFYFKQGYQWVDSYDDGDGHLKSPRLGFLVR